MVNSCDKTLKAYRKVRVHMEKTYEEQPRKEYFATIGAKCLENQHTGREETAEPTPI